MKEFRKIIDVINHNDLRETFDIEYNKKLNDIIKKEQLSPPLNTSVNKFKKMEEEPTRCIKSRILGTKNIKNIDECKLSSDSDSDWDSD